MKIFDCHSHWATEKGYIFRTDAERAQQEKVWRTPFKVFTEDEQADYFRRNNVRVILDISWIKALPLDEMRAYHDYVFDEQRKHRDVIFGQWLQFDPRRHGAAAVQEFRRCLDKRAGFAGLNINGQVTGVPASDPAWDPFYQASREAGLPVMILCGLTGIGQGLPGGLGIRLDDGHPRHVDDVAARYPELKILAARPAWPWQDEMIAILRHKANVSYELHGWGPKQFTPALKKEIRGRLQDRVMFGCDFPVLRYEKVLSDWKAEGYPPEMLAKILHDNAETYFGGLEK
ncbi:MAG: amidohydrolase [Betaproteobacteria bacterium]|nr:amidohydrolase [Betaproteobacteria bacterium]